MSNFSPTFTSSSASGFYSPPHNFASTNASAVWVQAGTTCVLSLSLSLPLQADPKLESEKTPAEADAGPERPLTRREALQRRMPPRTGIKAIIDRRRAKPDPWLDDKYDWKPEN